MTAKIWKHFKTITYHKYLVMQGCFKVGLYKQGLLHDLSKYSPDEFIVGAKYFQGDRSPNNAEREAIGYSSAWLHHKGRNKHHYEYWIDYSTKAIAGGMAPAPMPVKYVVEMLMDRMRHARFTIKTGIRTHPLWNITQREKRTPLCIPGQKSFWRGCFACLPSGEKRKPFAISAKEFYTRDKI